MPNTKILVTGAAGFIGFHLINKLLSSNDISVVGIDNLNNYYPPKLKIRRLTILKEYENFKFLKIDFSKWNTLKNGLQAESFDAIIHLGAQPGIPYSLKNPWKYIDSNITGTLNIFELGRLKDVKKIVYASSSSVYGNSHSVPFKEDECLEKQISTYAATKKCDELLSYTYHHLYGINMMGFRFFTVYGEYGRPDMAIWKFTKNIFSDKEIYLYNNGRNYRDFTYVDDIVDGIVKGLNADLGYDIFNLGFGKAVSTQYIVELLEKYIGKKAKIIYAEPQKGDLEITWADITKAKEMLGYEPKTNIEEGLKRFVTWFKNNIDWIKKL